MSSNGPGSIPGHSTIFLTYQIHKKVLILTYIDEKAFLPCLPCLPNGSFLDQSSSLLRQLPLSKFGSYLHFMELSEKKIQKLPSKKFGMVSWKLHIPTNIGLRSVIYTSNGSKNNMQSVDEDSFMIYIAKIREI